jgi:HK97 gp10 family phage protein
MSISARASLVRNPNLARFIDDTINPAVRASVQAACDLIADTARTLCPVDTGELRDSITVDVQQVAFQSITGTVFATAPYAEYVEFGTGRRGDPSVPHTDKPGMAAQPFMRPAVDENKAAIEGLFRDQVAVAVESA